MKILVPIKRVVDYNVKVRPKADESGVDLNNVKMAINPFCEIAVEEAVRLKEAGSATEIIAVTVGATNTQEQLRTALALGADRAILVETNLNQSLPLVYGNSNLLLQVLINLIGNALKFTHKDGAIIIQAYEIGSKVRIEIIDSGIGISFRSKKKIFNRFVRDENEVHTLKGTGLGLSIVDTILQNHNSTINVSSKKDVGSVFWFDLMKN